MIRGGPIQLEKFGSAEPRGPPKRSLNPVPLKCSGVRLTEKD
jgi:hypothetical protein